MPTRGDRSVCNRVSVARPRAETLAVVDYEDPSATQAIVAFDARTGERLDSEEVRKGRAKEMRELDEFKVKMEVDESEMRTTPGKKIWSKWVETRKDPNSPAIRATEVNTGEPRSDTFAATPPLKFVRLILSWAASYKPKRANASMIIAVFDISVAFFHGKVRKVIYVVPPKDLRKKGKIWRLLKSLYGTRVASQVFATYVEEGLNDHGFQRNAVVPCLYWNATLEALGVHWGDDFIFSIPDNSADDLEQLMREVFKVKICERIGPGCPTSIEVLHMKVSWSADGFLWTHDPKHTLALADGFGFNGKKQLERSEWNMTVAPGSKTVGKGLRDGADSLDEPEKQHFRSLVGTALYVGQDRPETKYATKEAARFMTEPTRTAKCMLKRLCKYYSEAPVLSWSFPYQEMPSEIKAVTDASWAGELEGLRSTSSGWIYFGGHLLETYSSTQQIVAPSTAESEYISITKGAAHALEVRSAMVEYGMTFNVVCETDASAGRAMATRRGVGRVRHLDARLLLLQ